MFITCTIWTLDLKFNCQSTVTTENLIIILEFWLNLSSSEGQDVSILSAAQKAYEIIKFNDRRGVWPEPETKTQIHPLGLTRNRTRSHPTTAAPPNSRSAARHVFK